MTTYNSLTDVKLEKLAELRRLRDELDRLDREEAMAEPGWESPGSLAQMLDPTIVQTPALQLIDRELVDLATSDEVDRN